MKRDRGHHRAKTSAASRCPSQDLREGHFVFGSHFSIDKAEGATIRITFDHADGGLVAKPLPATLVPSLLVPDHSIPLVRNSPNSPVEGFAICGDDQKWAWAHAAIDGETVLVSSPVVPHPVAVRYGWAEAPICNLSNGAGLPASPFRTDDYTLVTREKLFGK